MRAMILAAGLGTRLRPLTFVRPKVLVPVMGMTVLEFWIRQLHMAGFEAVVINAHNLHEKLVASIQGRMWPIPVEISVEPILLGTGGGIAKVLDFFQGESFAVVNGDIICRVSFKDLIEWHQHRGSPVSLLLHDFPAFNNVAVNGTGSVLGFGKSARDIAMGNRDVRLLAFTGIHIINPVALKGFPPDQPWEILSAYHRLISEGTEVNGIYADDLFWEEMGSVDAYRNLIRKLSLMPENSLSPLLTGRSSVIHPTAEVSSKVSLEGVNVVGRGTRLPDDVLLRNCILWDEITVKPGSHLRNCIVTDGTVVEGNHENEILCATIR